MQEAIIIAAVVVILIVAGIYFLIRSGRRLRRFNNQLDRDWLDIEVFIKQISDNLPRVIQTCRSYMPQPQASLTLLIEARKAYQKAASTREWTEAASKIFQAVQSLFSDANQFEGLKTNNAYNQIQNQLLEIEERVDERREAFNDDVARFNARLARFPGSLFAGKLKPREPWIVKVQENSQFYPVPAEQRRQPTRVKR